MTIDDKIRDKNFNMTLTEQLQRYLHNHQGRQRDEYLTCDEMLPPQQHRKIQEAKFTYFPIRKTFEKQTKTIVEQVKSQVNLTKPYQRDK